MKTPGIEPTTSSAPSKRKYSRMSTATAAQYERIAMLLSSGPKNTIELRRDGIMMPAARIKEMNDRHGFDIPTIDRINVFDSEGYRHPRVAVYELVNSPENAGALP